MLGFFDWLVLVNVSCKSILFRKRICSKWRCTYIGNMVSKREPNFLFLFFQEILACYLKKYWDMLKLSVKLSFLISALDVCITLVESFMRQTNLNKLKLFTTGGQTIAQHQMSSMSLLEVFLVKQLYPFSSLNLDWFQSLLKEPLQRVSAPGRLGDNSFKSKKSIVCVLSVVSKEIISWIFSNCKFSVGNKSKCLEVFFSC